MVILYETYGNFNFGIPSYRGLISKRSRGTIQISEDNLSFHSEADKILYQINMKDIISYYTRYRFRIPVIEIKDRHDNYYSLAPFNKVEGGHKFSKTLTEDFFSLLTRQMLRNDHPIIFESKGLILKTSATAEGDTKEAIQGLILLTQNHLFFKPFKSSGINQVKVLEIKNILNENTNPNGFIEIQTMDGFIFSLIPIKKHLIKVKKDKTLSNKLYQLLQQAKDYKETERLQQEELEKKRIEKVKSMLEVSARIKLKMMRTALEMDEELFNKKVFEWAKKFDFVVDGKYLIANNEKVSDFLHYLKDGQIRKDVCPFCNNLIDFGSKICPYCGEEIVEKLSIKGID